MEKEWRIIWPFKHKDRFLLTCLRLCNYYCGPVLAVANATSTINFHSIFWILGRDLLSVLSIVNGYIWVRAREISMFGGAQGLRSSLTGTIFVEPINAWNKQHRVGVNFFIKTLATLDLKRCLAQYHNDFDCVHWLWWCFRYILVRARAWCGFNTRICKDTMKPMGNRNYPIRRSLA